MTQSPTPVPTRPELDDGGAGVRPAGAIPQQLDLLSSLPIPVLPPANEDEPIVVAYGAGVDSTAMLIGLKKRGRRVDLILFADTGSEKPETYAYLDIMDQWLAANDMPTIIRLKRSSPKAGDTSLHGECLRKRILPSLAYGGHSCSLKWKVEPQWAYCKRHFGWSHRRRAWRHGPYITKLIGYDAGPADSRRTKKATGKWPAGHRYEYPLRDWGWDRARCVAEIEAAGLPVPLKSACFMCPASKKGEVQWLSANHPDLVRVAQDMEAKAHERGLRTVRGLGRSWSWTAFLDTVAEGQCHG